MRRLKDTYSFYHRIPLNDNLCLPGRMTGEQAKVLETIPKYIHATDHVLDIGARDGLFCVEAARCGATRIVAVDNDTSQLFTDIVIPWFGLNVEYVIDNFLNMGPEYAEAFDAVIFSGVLYHLRYPMYGIQRVASMLRPDGIMILETAFLDAFNEFPILLCPIGHESPYEATSVTFFNRNGLRDTIMSLGFSVTEVVDEFTYERNTETDYDRLPFPEGNSRHNIGRLIWVCKKDNPQIPKWTKGWPSIEQTRGYWNTSHDFHHKAVRDARIAALAKEKAEQEAKG